MLKMLFFFCSVFPKYLDHTEQKNASFWTICFNLPFCPAWLQFSQHWCVPWSLDEASFVDSHLLWTVFLDRPGTESVHPTMEQANIFWVICLDNVVKGHSYLCDISLHADLKIILQPMDSRQFKIVTEKKVLF